MVGLDNSRQAPVRHPWREWFGLGAFTIERGTHYTCRTDTMAQQVRNAAARLKYKVTLSISDDANSVSVWVTGRA